jgi:hypothetical protein
MTTPETHNVIVTFFTDEKLWQNVVGIIIGAFFTYLIWRLQYNHERKDKQNEVKKIRKNLLCDLLVEAKDNLEKLNSNVFSGYTTDWIRAYINRYSHLFAFSDDFIKVIIQHYVSTAILNDMEHSRVFSPNTGFAFHELSLSDGNKKYNKAYIEAAIALFECALKTQDFNFVFEYKELSKFKEEKKSD